MAGAVQVGALIINMSANVGTLKADLADVDNSTKSVAQSMANAWAGVTAASDSATSAGKRLIDSLKDEIATFGMTSTELTLHKAQLNGVGDEAQALISRLQGLKDAQDSFGAQTDIATAAAKKQADAITSLSAAEAIETARIRDMVAASQAESAAMNQAAQAADASAAAQTRLGSSAAQVSAGTKQWQQNMAGVTAAMKATSDQSTILSADTQKILDKYDPLGTKLRSLQSDLGLLRKAMGDSVDPAAIKAFQGLEDEIDKTSKLMQQAGAEGFKASADGADKFSFASAGAVRELIVLGREAISGNFSKMPGSFLLLTQRIGATSLLLNPLTIGFAGAAVAGAALFGLAQEGHDDFVALNNALLSTNNYAGQTRQSMLDLASSVANTGELTIGTSKQIVTGLVSSGQIGGQALATIAGLAENYAKSTGQDVDSITPKLVHLFADPLAGAQELNTSMHFLTQTDIDHIATLIRLGQVQAAQAELAGKLSAALPDQSKNVTQLTSAYDLLAKAASTAYETLKQHLTGTTDPYAQTVKDLQDNIDGLRTSGADDSEIDKAQKALNTFITTTKAGQVVTQQAAQAASAAQDVQNAGQLSLNKSQLTHIQQLKDELSVVAAQPDSTIKAERELEIQKEIDNTYRSIGADARAATAEQITQQEALSEISLQGSADQIASDLALGLIDKQQFNDRMLNNKLDVISVKELQEMKMANVAGLTDNERQAHVDQLARLKAEFDMIEQEGVNGALADEKKAYDDMYAAINAAADSSLKSLNDQIKQEQLHGLEIGKTKAQVDLLHQAQSQAAIDELKAQVLATEAQITDQGLQGESLKIAETNIDNLNAEIIARETLARQQGSNGSTQAAADAAKDLDKFLDPTKANAFGDTLGKAFDSATDAISKTAKVMQDFGAQSAKFDKARLDALTAFNGGQIDQATYTKDLNTLSNKQTQDQLGAYGDMAGAAAGFFGTQSKGYKALQAASEVFHAVELAMSAEELAVKLFGATTAAVAQTASIQLTTGEVVASVPVVVAAEGAKASAFGLSAMAAALAAPFPENLAAFAIVGALVAGLGILVSGGSASGNTDTSKATQAAAGTGTTLGDPTAKSDSIANSLAAIDKNTYEGITVSQSMLTALETLNTGIDNLGALITQNLGLTASGAAQGAAALVQLTSSTGLSKLFGGSSTSLDDTGIKIDSTSLATAITTGLKGVSYADTTTSSSFFGISLGSSSDEKTQALSAELDNQFTAVVKSLHDGTLAAADALGLGGDAFDTKLNSFVVDLGKISLKGLTGDQITTELNNVFSSLGDDMANFAVSGLAQFQQVGEGAFETLTRIANDYQTVDAVLASFGDSFGAVGFASVAARENLISLSGGLDDFTSQADYFLKNFFTDAEQAAQLKPAVDAQIESVNNGQTVTTTEQFKDLVLSLDLTTAAGQQAYATLMNIAPAFQSIVQAAGGKSAADIASERSDLQDQLDNLTMTSTQLLTKQRDALDASNDALFDQIQAITAANDALAAASTAGSAALTALQTSVTAQKAAVQAAADAQTAALQTQEDAATATLQSVTSILSTLSSAVDSAQQAQTLTLGLRQQAEDTITGILKQVTAGASLADVGGDNSGLSQAISTLAQPSTNLYSSFVDYARDQAQANNTLTALQKSATGQVDTAQEMVDKLTAQIKAVNDQTTAELARLDALVTTGQAQLDAANGTTDAVLSLQEAINDLSTAIAGISATSSANAGGSDGAPTGASAASAISGLYESLLGRAPEAAGLAFWEQSYANGNSLAQIAKDIEASPEYMALHPFAVGTNYITQDMPAYVHKGERIMPAADNRELMARLSSPAGNNDALLAEIKALRQTVAKQQKNLNVISEATARSADMYEQNTAKGGPALVQIVGKVTVAS